MSAPRTREQRLRDTRRRFDSDIDSWLATADNSGTPHLIPVSFLWDGSAFLISTALESVTARNLRANGRARMAFGTTRDVVIVEGIGTALEHGALPAEAGDAFAARTGFDPRELATPYEYFLIHPRRIRAWREVNELPGRTLMDHGHWLG